MTSQVAAALLLSFPLFAGGAGEALAGGDASEVRATTARTSTSRGAWAVLEAHRSVNDAVAPTSKVPRRGLKAFAREGNSRRVSLLRYETPLSLGQNDFILKVRAPGGRGAIMRVELKF